MREKYKQNLRGQELSLKDLIDMESWQEIQNKFSAVTEVGIRLVGAKGNLLTLPSGQPRLCVELVKEGYIRNRACGKNCLPTFLGGMAVVDKNLGFICEVAGLHNFVTPLRIDNDKVLCYFIIGPVILVSLKPKEEYRKTAEKLGLNLEDFWNAIIEIKVMSFHGIQSLVELVKDVGEFTLKLAYQKIAKEKEIIMPIDSSKMTRLLDALLDVAFEISQADIGSVMIFDKADKELTIWASRGICDEIIRNTRVKLGYGIAGLAAKEGEPFLIDKNTQDNRIRPYLKRPHISSSLVIPLKIEEHVLGVMNLGILDASSSVRFNKESMGLMRKLVDLATVAIRP